MTQEEDNWKDKFTQFRTLQQHSEQITEHIQQLHQQMFELDISTNAVKEIGSTDKDTEILAPLANGIFLKSTLQDNKKLIVNVGADTTVEKSVDEVVKLLESQHQKLDEKIMEAESVLHNVQMELMRIYEQVQAAE